MNADQAMIMLMGIFMLLLGVLLIPVNFGLLPFSGSAQLGLLMVFFAVQMLATGNTAIRPFPRSWAIILLGFLFAAFGVVSCIIPEILVPQITVFIGVLNIAGGSITIAKTLFPVLKTPGVQSGSRPPIMRKLFAATLTMNLLAVLFGISMLFSRLLPGFVIGIVLAANGCVLLYLLRILLFLENDKGAVGAGA